MYILCIYTYMISATALCAFGVTGLDSFAFRLLLSDLLLIVYNMPSPNLDGRQPGPHSRVPSPPWAALENHCFCYKSLLIFTISLSGSII